MTTTTDKSRKTIVVPAFGVIVDHPRNCDILLQSVPGCRLRSKLKTVTVAVGGEIRAQQIKGVAPPEVPGMELHIDPASCKYLIVDKLNDDDNARARLKQFIRRSSGVKIDSDIKGVDDQHGTLDVHRMKNLCREIIWLLEEGSVKMIKGPMPELEDVSPWHDYGQRRSLDEFGRIADRPVSDDIFPNGSPS